MTDRSSVRQIYSWRRDFAGQEDWFGLQNRTLLAIIVWMAAFAVYWGTVLFFQRTGTPNDAYFHLLADAFLHGRLYLVEPPDTEDLTFFQGQWYLAYPPLPTLLMLPWVALAGVENIDAVLFVALFASFNVVLVFLLLTSLARHRLTQLSMVDNLWLTLLFALGCVHWCVASCGSVWYAAQICTVTFVALAAWLCVERSSPWLVGVALGLAMAARPHVALTWPLLLGITATYLNPQSDRTAWRSLIGWAIKSAVPIVGVVMALLLYNAVRFGDPFDFGYLTMNVGDVLGPDLKRYGQFDLYFLPKNFWAMWLALPVWSEQRQFWKPDVWGMSLLLTTPALIYLPRAFKMSWLAAGAWTSFGLLMIPLLLYFSTGYGQFGYRYSLDFMIPVMILLAIAAGARVSWPMRILILAGVLINFAGTAWWLGGLSR